ncbi:MAG: biotin carboxylase N-terminal domain-containing protein [Bacteriovoracaceae bacterium]|nr:biotin carboxylase N-terminal domain-containing protein [Bacteriovoracaceae bacterium]
MKRILIANRGEIAIRVAKAARELGHIAIGVWTDFETNAPHLSYCQEWVHLAGNNNTETFLNIKKIISLCKEHKIDAVHPGYGFLSENAEFSKALKDNGLIFIGPKSEAVHLMGDKAISKQTAVKCGVPVVPGSTGAVGSVEEAKEISKKIGYPVLLKAVAGGGGKGMRVCQQESELANLFEAVQRESKNSFGNPDLLIEKYIVNPHHIEVQIMGDKKGNVFHFYERECSIQRRHQKIIEEAPSPFIGDDQALRKRICETAVKLGQSVGYDSAGTVEFVMGEDRNFYFLEMNTRIQVEHPITEEITGIDLVSNMIRVAFEEPLDFKSQSDIIHYGHSIEARLCAEDPITMLPAAGTIEDLQYILPQGGRFDHCAFSGYQIKSDFDPMFGKFIVYATNRELALKKIIFGLDNLFITGLKCNIPLLKEIFQEEDFQKGHYDTGYIGQHMDALSKKIQSKMENKQNEKLLEHGIARLIDSTLKL